jgi:hypothetical protein
MGLIKKLSDWFSPSSKPDEQAYWLTAKCLRCGEVIRSRVDLRNDLSLEYEEEGGGATYFCRKVLMGESGRCFQRIEVELTFDADHRLTQREISGGEFIDV